MQWPIQGGPGGLGPPLLKTSATTPPPPHWTTWVFWDHGKCLLLPPPPLNRVGLRRRRWKISATPPPHWIASAYGGDHGRFPLLPPPHWIASAYGGDHGRFPLLPPPPLSHVDLALRTKGAPSLGRSWICDWYDLMVSSVVKWNYFWYEDRVTAVKVACVEYRNAICRIRYFHGIPRWSCCQIRRMTKEGAASDEAGSR